MPTVLKKNGFRFYFYHNENLEPAHIHIDYGGGSAKFWLIEGEGVLVYELGFKSQQVRSARKLIREHYKLLRSAYANIHGR
jgi:hypothetical protein